MGALCDVCIDEVPEPEQPQAVETAADTDDDEGGGDSREVRLRRISWLKLYHAELASLLKKRERELRVARERESMAARRQLRDNGLEEDARPERGLPS